MPFAAIPTLPASSFEAQNEVHSKVIEIDARPSDCIVLATQAKAPIFVSQDVWEETEDRTEELEKIRQALREKKAIRPARFSGRTLCDQVSSRN